MQEEKYTVAVFDKPRTSIALGRWRRKNIEHVIYHKEHWFYCKLVRTYIPVCNHKGCINTRCSNHPMHEIQNEGVTA